MQPPERERTGEILQYRWSSLPEYIDGKRRDSWITYEAVLGYVGGSRQKYGEFVQDGIRKVSSPHGKISWPRWFWGTGISLKG